MHVIFKPSSSLLLLVCLFLIGTSKILADPLDDREFNNQVRQVFDKNVQTREIGDWVFEEFGDSIRQGTDRAVTLLLRKHPLARALYPAIHEALRQENLRRRVQFLSQNAVASPGKNGQFSKQYKMVQKTAEQLFFPLEARNNIFLAVIQSSDVNAFTWNGLPTTSIELAEFTELQKLMRRYPGAEESVIAHELGHQILKHPDHGLLAAAIFNATGEIIIPDDEPSKQVILADALRTMVRSFSWHDQMDDLTATAYTEIIKAQTANAKAKYKDEEIANLGADLAEAMGAQGIVREATKKPGFGLKAMLEFKRRMVILSQSQETDADRVAVICTGLENSVRADVLLAGGESANPAAILRQQEEAAKMRADHPWLDAIFVDDGDHPQVNERAAGYKSFLLTPGYRINTSPFLRGLDTYFRLSRLIGEFDRQIARDDRKEKDLNLLAVERDRFERFAKELEELYVAAVSEEFHTLPNNFARFEAVVAALRKNLEVIRMAEASDRIVDVYATELTKPRQMLNDLLAVVLALPEQHAKREPALAILRGIIPLDLSEVKGMEEFLTAARAECPAVLSQMSKVLRGQVPKKPPLP